jgi:hypothetical protein
VAQATGMREDHDLPYVDQHALTIAAPRAAVWAALEGYIADTLGATKMPLLGRVLGTDPPSGFGVAQREPERRLALAGRHRFSRYRLVFELADESDDGEGTVLRALTYAMFPGAHGRAYRMLVIGTRLHVLATRGILRAVARRSVDGSPSFARAPATSR